VSFGRAHANDQLVGDLAIRIASRQQRHHFLLALGQHIVGVMLVQRMPDLTDQVLRLLWPRFQTTAYQALDD